ncbi:hypothetical protein ABZZ79_02955 [Streptomyces sp. NPDC006458]|uniref:hypothetical protein n=1 Tax=Streptomyces sp. NPDC006458 TaxID=3154302 RepID=UPI0033B36296
MTTITPNPHSPYATATPDHRHIIDSFDRLLGAPKPGGLVPTACNALAVVPEEPLRNALVRKLPDGVCPDCIAVTRGGQPPHRPTSQCKDCGSPTGHGDLCAVCRQERHEEWWPTRCNEQAADEAGE